MREHAEDTIWWTIKSAVEFNAHRRTIVLFHANTTNPFTWIDNTNAAWEPLTAILSKLNPRTIAINTHHDVAHASGMHVGEMEVLRERIGEEWVRKFMQIPEMMVVEFVGRRTDVGTGMGTEGLLEMYRKLEETTWAIVEEAFSEKVVVPGRTTTDVRFLLSVLIFPHILLS